MIRRFILYLYIRALEKYLDFPSLNSQTNSSFDFLANAWRTNGFREYAKKRNDDLIYESAGGSGLTPHGQLKYAELLGRRIENLNLTALAKKAFEVEEQRKKQKVNQNH